MEDWLMSNKLPSKISSKQNETNQLHNKQDEGNIGVCDQFLLIHPHIYDKLITSLYWAKSIIYKRKPCYLPNDLVSGW